MEERIGEYWSEELPESHRKALYGALCILTDDFLGDAEHDKTLIASLLPSRHLPRYTGLFYRRFFVAILTVGYKLGQDEPPLPLLSCTAEELALHVLIEEAKYLLEEEDVEAGFGLFEDVVFQDADFEYLYVDRFDGIEDSDTGAKLAIGNLHFDEWFEPFLNAFTQIHPYSRSEGTSPRDSDLN